MRAHPISSAIVLASLASLLLGSTAHADDRAIAAQAFQEGRELMKEGKVAEACPKFAAAAQLSQTTGVRLNLADCYARLGKTASAWSKADEALALAERAGDSAAAGLARDQMAALKPKLSYLTIAVDRATSTPGTEVALDGEKIPDALWGTPFPVDPGEHDVTARAPGSRPWETRTTVVGAAAHASVSVPVLFAAETTAPSLVTPPAETPAPPASTGRRPLGAPRTLALVSGGLGLVGIGVGAAFGLVASSKKSDYQQHQAGGRCVDEQCAIFSKDAVTAATVSTVGFVVGAALVVGGVALWLTAPAKDTTAHAVAVVPILGPQTAGAGFAGTW